MRLAAPAPRSTDFGPAHPSHLRAVYYADPLEHYCHTRFADDLYVPARPMETEEYQARAVSLGYGESSEATWYMCSEHEWLHSYAARLLGFPCSPTLRAVACGSEMCGWVG